MLRVSNVKLQLITTAITLMSLAGGSVALASSASGSQDPSITVTASLASNGANPDQATVGNSVTATASETNNTAGRDGIRVTYTLAYPDGRAFANSKQLNLSPGQTQVQSKIYTVAADDPRGTYTYTVAATDGNGASSATATIQVN